MSAVLTEPVGIEALPSSKPAFLRRVRIRGYKSIASCDVTLEPLTVLVGRNGSGKSNFLDALAFLRDLMTHGAREAVKLHGGHEAVWHVNSRGSRLCIEADASFSALTALSGPGHTSYEPWRGTFAAELGLSPTAYPAILRERGALTNEQGTRQVSFTAEGGRVAWDGDPLGAQVSEWANQDKAFLSTLMSAPFEGLHQGLQAMLTYNFSHDAIRRPQKPSRGGFLDRDGGNLASVIETTRDIDEGAVRRVGQYLNAITRSVAFERVVRSGGYETMLFRVPVADNGHGTAVELPAAGMSDGTLRALAGLMAAYQAASPHASPSLVAIEEPETSLHPAAMHALVDAFDEATLRTQVLLTTHSADLLDNPTIKPENVRAVRMIDGQTIIAPLDEANFEIVRRKLNTLGGLEREDRLEADLDEMDRHQQGPPL